MPLDLEDVAVGVTIWTAEKSARLLDWWLRFCFGGGDAVGLAELDSMIERVARVLNGCRRDQG